MRVRIWGLVAGLALIAIGLICAVSYARERSIEENCQRVLRTFGWETEGEAELSSIILPAVFDDAYLEYEALQNKAGFSLLSYCGRTLTQRTYRLKGRRGVYLHLLLDGETVVGGDVCNPDLKDGFLLSLTGD